MLKNEVAKEIKILSSRVIKSELGYGNAYARKYYCSLRGYKFPFTDSIYNYQNCIKVSKENMLECLLLDRNCYENSLDLQDFMQEFGYDNRKEGLRVYEACRDTAEAINGMFTKAEIEQLEQEFNESESQEIDAKEVIADALSVAQAIREVTGV